MTDWNAKAVEFVRFYQYRRGLMMDGKAGDATFADLRNLLGLPPETAPDGLRASQKAIDLIHDFEQFRANAYKDPGSSNGLPITIGWGSTRNADGSRIKLGDVWTREQADAQFRRDLEKTEAKVRSALQGSPATQGQFDALVSFAYNVGTDAMNQSTLMDKHRAGDYAGAKAQFARWNKNDGIVLAGLIRRRTAEAALYAS